MGIHIFVHFDPELFSETDWSSVYDVSLTLLQRWPDPPIGPRQRDVAGVTVTAYSRTVEGDDGWHVCGDATSRRCAESMRLPRKLGTRCPRPPSKSMAVRVAHDERLHTLFGDKTQGERYHSLILAVAMLIESRLPAATLVRGDITAREAREAQTLVETLIGERIPIPRAVDPDRLRSELAQSFEDEALEEAFKRTASLDLDPGTRGIVNDLLGVFQRTSGHRELETAVACTDAEQLSPKMRDIFRMFVRQIGRNAAKQELSTELRDFDAPKRLAFIAQRLQHDRGMTLTEMAWDDLEQAGLDELEFLVSLSLLRGHESMLFGMLRALFESTALRTLAMDWFRSAD